MTLMQSLRKIREALVAAEAAHPNSEPLKKLHRKMQRALDDHWFECGLNQDEVSTLGGGTPKQPV